MSLIRALSPGQVHIAMCFAPTLAEDLDAQVVLKDSDSAAHVHFVFHSYVPEQCLGIRVAVDPGCFQAELGRSNGSPLIGGSQQSRGRACNNS